MTEDFQEMSLSVPVNARVRIKSQVTPFQVWTDP